jgi:hypothetical protein
MDEAVRTTIKRLYRKGDTIEVRSFDKFGEKYVGRYKYGTAVLDAIQALEDAKDHDIYLVLNPTSKEETPLLRHGLGTWEQEVPWWRWFLLDCDPIREYKIATEEQFQAALKAARKAKAWLEGYGYSDIVLASSGNGVHLLVPCEQPNTPETKRMVRSVQRAVADWFSNSMVEIECFNDANRLVRCYGTTNSKGVETDALKHRKSGIIE